MMLLLVLITLLNCDAESTDPLVMTDLGWVRGQKSEDGDYNMFMGIPYAKVDHENPFGHSIPATKFDGIFDANDDTAICPQVEEFNNTIVGTLDCLHVNVYVPNSAFSDPAVRLPVLVWVYGGAFEIGFHGRFLYGPKYLVRHDVILVTLNYRIGPYGFMCLDIPEVPGNQGLKDQLLAFQWIKENIASFGGDPDRITAFGESAGAMSIDAHINFKGIPFRNAVLQSGSAMMTDMVRYSNPNIPITIAERIGLRPKNVHEALQMLAELTPAAVIDAATKVGYQFWPCVEKQFHGVENFITDYPTNIDIPAVNGMNLLVGYNSDERMIPYALSDSSFYQNWNGIYNNLKASFDFEDEEQLQNAVNAVRQFYIGDKDISENVKWELADFESDAVFTHAIERAINKYLKNRVNKVYYYMLSYNGERNLVKRMANVTEKGAAHADDIGYLFDTQLDIITDPPTPDDRLILDRMTTMWANFAKYDDPTPEPLQILPVHWEPINRGSARYYLNIDSKLTLGTNPLDQRMRFWDDFFEKYGKYQKGYRRNSAPSVKNNTSRLISLLSFLWFLSLRKSLYNIISV